jgi:hypothetical protein
LQTNQSRTNLLPADLANMLVNLQADLQELLPALAAFNDSFDFIAVQPVVEQSELSPPSGENLSVNLSTNLSTSPQAGNLGANLSSVVGYTATAGFPAPSSVNFLPPGMVYLGSTVGPTEPAFTSNPVPGPMMVADRDSLRALLILQNDLQRVFPIVDTVNGAAAGTLPNGAVSRGAANSPSFVPNRPVTTPPTPVQPYLSPTGR